MKLEKTNLYYDIYVLAIFALHISTSRIIRILVMD